MNDSNGAGREFRKSSQIVLEFLRTQAPMGLWSVTRIENDRQTHLILGENVYDLDNGDSAPWEDSICIHMVAGEGPRIAADAAQVPAYTPAILNSVLEIGAYAGAPIKDTDGSLFGVLCGLDPAATESLHGLDAALNAMGELLAVALSADRSHRSLEAQLRHAQEASMTDPLTGLGNRRAWDQWLELLEEDFRDLADPTVLTILDLDEFKAINDGPGGHSAGDAVLKSVATALETSARPRDRIARIGGDEFGLILADCPHAQAAGVVKRCVAALREIGVEVSAGWAPLQVGHPVESAVRAADDAMFMSKRGGSRDDAVSLPRPSVGERD